MCIGLGIEAGRELDAMKGLMAMSLMGCISDVADVDIDEVQSEMSLAGDLSLDENQIDQLKELIADTFDGVEAAIGKDATVADLLNQVVLAEFDKIGSEAA